MSIEWSNIMQVRFSFLNSRKKDLKTTLQKSIRKHYLNLGWFTRFWNGIGKTGLARMNAYIEQLDQMQAEIEKNPTIPAHAKKTELLNAVLRDIDQIDNGPLGNGMNCRKLLSETLCKYLGISKEALAAHQRRIYNRQLVITTNGGYYAPSKKPCDIQAARQLINHKLALIDNIPNHPSINSPSSMG